MQFTHEKAKSIRLLILDVDGTLTNGVIYYGTQEIEIKGFHIHDGLGIKLLQRAGILVAIISAKTSESVARRIRDLDIPYYYHGQDEKLPAYNDLKNTLQLADDEIAYMGDDLPDLPLLRRVGLAITLPHAPAILQQHADYITKNEAGNGAVREICELILESQDKYQLVIQSYLTK